MFTSALSIWSMTKLQAAFIWQMVKMLARFYAVVIPATVRVEMTRRKKRRDKLARYLVECGEWKLRAIILHSGRTVTLSSLSLTKRTEERVSTSTGTTRRATVQPQPAVSSPPVVSDLQSQASVYVPSSLSDEREELLLAAGLRLSPTGQAMLDDMRRGFGQQP